MLDLPPGDKAGFDTTHPPSTLESSASQTLDAVTPQLGKRGGRRGRKVHFCTYTGCEKVYTRKEHVLRHQRSRHQPDTKLFCNRCNKTLPRGVTLQKHEATKTHKSNVLKHELFHHLPSPAMTYERAGATPVSTPEPASSNMFSEMPLQNPWAVTAVSSPSMVELPERDGHGFLGISGQHVGFTNRLTLHDRTFRTSASTYHNLSAPLWSGYAPTDEASSFLHGSHVQANTSTPSFFNGRFAMPTPPTSATDTMFALVPGHHVRLYDNYGSYREIRSPAEQHYPAEQFQMFARPENRRA